MKKYLIHSNSVRGPATHVIVIGVGAYPHLIGGSDALCNDHDGMRQIESPPISAKSFAKWLIENFNNPDKPLATVSLLLSESIPEKFQNPKTGQNLDVKVATFKNVFKAIKKWKARGDQNPGNLLIFYFCGHGISQGLDTSLLLADFGQDEDNPLANAIDFRKFYLGMDQCAALQQCFFIDASG